MEVYISQFMLFLLIFARIGAFVAIAPVIGHSAVPLHVKIAISLFVSYLMYPLLLRTGIETDMAFGLFFFTIIQEMTLGLLIGFVSMLIFAGAQYAGSIISFNMGLYFANMFDPESSQQIPILSSFMYLFSMLIFIVVNGHHVTIQALQVSYVSIPIGEFAFSISMLERFITAGSTIFVVAVMLSAPILVALFLVNVGFGLLARVVPRMNVFIVSFPLKIGLGIMILMTTMPMLGFVFKKLLTDFQRNMMELVTFL